MIRLRWPSRRDLLMANLANSTAQVVFVSFIFWTSAALAQSAPNPVYNPIGAVAAEVDGVIALLRSADVEDCVATGTSCAQLADAFEAGRSRLLALRPEITAYLPAELGVRAGQQLDDLTNSLSATAASARLGGLTHEQVASALAASGNAIHTERPIVPPTSSALNPTSHQLQSATAAELSASAPAPPNGGAAAASFPTDPALLDETIEVEFSPQLDALLASLQNDPLLVYDFIRNFVRFTPYYGSRKSSTFVLETFSGNDFDQASLLIAAFRRLGIPARYVRGTIQLTNAELQQWIGVDSFNTALQTLLNGFYPVALGGGLVRVEHVWVEAFFDIADYRGVGGGTSEGAWIPLSPSFHLRSSNGGPDLAQELAFDLGLFMDGLFAGLDGRNPAEIYLDDLTALVAANHPGEQLPGLLWQTEPVPLGLEVLPSSLPATVVNELETSTEVPESFRHKLTINADVLSHTVNLAELGSRRVTLAFEPATQADQDIIDGFGNIFDTPANLINVRPELLIDGQVVATGSGVPFGSFVTAGVNYLANGHSSPSLFAVNRTTNVVAGGRYALIALADQGVEAGSVPAHKTAFAAGVANIGGPDFDPDETLGEALFLQGWEYFRELTQTTDVLARSAHIYFQNGVAAAFVGPNLALFQSGGEIVAVEPRGLEIDVFLNVGSPLEQDGAAGINPDDFRIFRSLEASALEHSVFEEVFDVEAISTVKVLQVAVDQGIPLFDIDSTNRDTLVPQLTLSATDVASIEAFLDAGFSVKVHRDPVTLNQWTGAGFLAFTPDGTSVSAIISGFLNGGSLTKIIQFLVDLVRTGIISQLDADLILFDLFDRVRFPVDDPINSGFGPRGYHPVTGQPNSIHEGVDFLSPVNTPVFSVADGLVAMDYVSSTFGNVIVVNHGVDGSGNNYYTLYAHNQSITVDFDDFVFQGDELSRTGQSGQASGPHLHYEVFVVPPGGPEPDLGSSGTEPNGAFFFGGFEVDPADLVWPEELDLMSPP